MGKMKITAEIDIGDYRDSSEDLWLDEEITLAIRDGIMEAIKADKKIKSYIDAKADKLIGQMIKDDLEE